MSPSSELDGVDFRPFFDMVVGILFVLLILIGALIFFQQTQDGVAGSPAQSELRRWRAQRITFLERLASDLQARGLPARVDTAAGTVTMPLDVVADLAGAGLPQVRPAGAAGLAAALAPVVACVSVPRAAGPDCADTDLLSLDGLSVQVRVGAASPNAALPRDRSARYLSATLSNVLYGDAPALLRASDRVGGAAVAFDAGTVGDGRSGGPGELALVFGLVKPVY
ncbi:MAG: hypothetical protein ACRYGP_33320 [Janthinobacterium lividum]